MQTRPVTRKTQAVCTPWTAVARGVSEAERPPQGACVRDLADVRGVRRGAPVDLKRRARRVLFAAAMLFGAGLPMVSVMAATTPAAGTVMVQDIARVSPANDPRTDIRPGSRLLIPGRAVRPDHYPGVQSTAVPSPFGEAAPNFRQLSGEPIYGTAQPTAQGVRDILDRLGAGPKGSAPTVMWTNFRQEPFVLINGTPYTLKDLKLPFESVLDRGASAAQVEQTDSELKREVLEQAAQDGGNFTIMAETAEGKLFPQTLHVQSVQTARELYEQLKAEGYRVDYARVPVSDERAPTDSTVDTMIARLQKAGTHTPQVFNCQAGHGRTTTGMVIADLMRRAALGGNPRHSILHSEAVHQAIREDGRFDRGNYRVILRLIHSLEHGQQIKDAADASINRAATLINLRTQVNDERKIALNPSNPMDKRSRAVQTGDDFLARYFKIVAIDAYLKEQAPQHFRESFSQWSRAHHLQQRLEHLQMSLLQTPRWTAQKFISEFSREDGNRSKDAALV